MNQKDSKPVNQKIKLIFFKKTGKYYACGHAIVRHFLFEDAFKQDIIDSQDCLGENWMGEFHVMTEEIEDDMSDGETIPFATRLFDASEFVGMNYEGNDKK